MKHVNWPTRKQAVAFTAVVIGLTLVFAVFLGAFDTVFRFGLEALIK